MEESERAQFFYENGNQMFKSGDYPSAVESYSSAIDYCCLEQHNLTNLNPLLCQKLLLNRAQCYLNMREYTSAVKDCSLVLTLDSFCSKAYIRRAIAYENLGDFRKGLSDADSATRLRPPASLMEAIIKLSSRLRALVICDEKAIAAEGRPDRMVTDRQTLRLNFLESLPRKVSVGEPFLLRLCIGNEFGLWDRSFLSNVLSQSLPVVDSKLSKVRANSIVAPIKVCVQIIFLKLNKNESDFDSRKEETPLVIMSKNEDFVLGPDGKVRSYQELPREI